MAIAVNRNIIKVASALSKAAKKSKPKPSFDNEVPEKKFKVKSSNIKSISYDNASRDLTITFLKGSRTYLYADVPAHVYLKLLNSQSKGEYFHQHIRFTYNYSEVFSAKGKSQKGR